MDLIFQGPSVGGVWSHIWVARLGQGLGEVLHVSGHLDGGYEVHVLVLLGEGSHGVLAHGSLDLGEGEQSVDVGPSTGVED